MMCLIRSCIQNAVRYVNDLIDKFNISVLDEEINEVNIGPGQSINVDEYGYIGVITCISYDKFIVSINSDSRTYNSINECYNWIQRSARYMMEFDYHID